MKNFGLLVNGLLFAGSLRAQLNISQVGHLDYQALHQSNLSNLWGYADEDGNEYALVGVNGTEGDMASGGLSVVDVTDPANPVEVFFAPAPPSIWREVKVWGDHAYVTTEAQFGLQIIDLSPLPESTDLPVTIFQGNGWNTAHTLFIDENGRLYVNGTNRDGQGVIMYDLTQDPEAPVEVGVYDFLYCHDSYARGDTLYAAHVYDGLLSMVDVSDPAAPVQLGTTTTPSGTTHNIWLDQSGRYAFTTDEVANAYVTAYDVSDPTDIVEMDRIQSDPGQEVIPHNTYWLDHFLVTSYYTSGVVIYDATRPGNLVETGHFDTSPFTGCCFRGAWGVYPFLPSGRLLVSDIEGGLYILEPTYVHAAWLEGLVTNAGTGVPVNQATISLGTADASDNTGFDGRYALGTSTGGTYTVTASAPGFQDAVVTGVQLIAGELTVLDIQLGASTGVGENGARTDAGLHVAPNPGYGDFTITLGGGSGMVELRDLLGRTVMGPFAVDGTITLDGKALPAGSYMVRAVRAQGTPVTTRWVKQ